MLVCRTMPNLLLLLDQLKEIHRHSYHNYLLSVNFLGVILLNNCFHHKTKPIISTKQLTLINNRSFFCKPRFNHLQEITDLNPMKIRNIQNRTIMFSSVRNIQKIPRTEPFLVPIFPLISKTVNFVFLFCCFNLMIFQLKYKFNSLHPVLVRMDARIQLLVFFKSRLKI